MSIANFLLGIFLKRSQRQLMKLSAQHRLHRSRKWMALNRSKPDADIALRSEVIAGVSVEWVVPHSLVNQHQIGVVIYFHGGAFVMGGPSSHRDMAAYLAKKAGVWLLMVDYRLAPEHPFPAALEDASALFLGLLERGVTPGQIVMGGDSAGGNIALATVQHLHAMVSPIPKALFLFSPWLDLRNSSPSHQRNAATDALLNQTLLEESVARYAPNTPRDNVRISPILGAVTGLPPCLIVASATEILQDDALTLRDKLQQSGVQVRYLEWPYTPHAFPVMARWLPEARVALDRTAQFIRQQLAL